MKKNKIEKPIKNLHITKSLLEVVDNIEKNINPRLKPESLKRGEIALAKMREIIKNSKW